MGARSPALWDCRSDTSWWKSWKVSVRVVEWSELYVERSIWMKVKEVERLGGTLHAERFLLVLSLTKERRFWLCLVGGEIDQRLLLPKPKKHGKQKTPYLQHFTVKLQRYRFPQHPTVQPQIFRSESSLLDVQMLARHPSCREYATLQRVQSFTGERTTIKRRTSK